MNPDRYRRDERDSGRAYRDVDAVQVTASNAQAICDWVNAHHRREEDAFWGRTGDGDVIVYIPFLTGHLEAPEGDWVLRSDTDVFTTVTGESFALAYRPVDPADPT